jgi:hypothetical protein
MNCPKCQTPAAAGAAHCKRCGSPLGGKAAPSKAASSSDEIDLMPLEEPKTPAYSAYEPPPGLDLPGAAAPAPKLGPKAAPEGPAGPPGADYVPKIRGASASPPRSKLNLIIGGAVAALILGFIVWRMVRTKNEIIVGKPKVEQVITLPAGQLRLENIEVTGIVNYTLDIDILEGEMIAGVVQRSHKDSQKLADLKKCDPLETLKKGDKKTFTGEFKNKEQASWMLLNESKKVARAKVKFHATPQ